MPEQQPGLTRDLKKMKKSADKFSMRERVLAGCIPKAKDDCWVWVESTNNKGYAHLRYSTKMFRASRFAYEAFIGPIPEGKHVLHKCDNRRCVNPDHLFLGTDLDNCRDKFAKGRENIMRGEHHPRAILDEAKVRIIRRSVTSADMLAKEFGVLPGTIKAVRYRRIWKNVEP